MADVEDAQRIPRDVRVAGATLDVAKLTSLVADPAIQPHLQEAGEAVLTVLDHDPVGADQVARALLAALAGRDWPGDAELAELLAELVYGQPSDRRRIRADLDGVADLLEGSPEMGFGGILDCETGDAWPEAVVDDGAEDDVPDPDRDPDRRYLLIPNEGSREAWEDMRDFALDVEQEHVRQRLLDAIDGRGAFSRFRRVLDDHDELRAHWFAYSAETRAGRARQWLAAEGYAALPPRQQRRQAGEQAG